MTPHRLARLQAALADGPEEIRLPPDEFCALVEASGTTDHEILSLAARWAKVCHPVVVPANVLSALLAALPSSAAK